jgi:signal transduction histidine kinase
MYRRLVILSLIIVVALGGLSWLGYRAISVWSQGIEGTRITEFANVAEQIRSDVNDKLDAFKEREQNRPYTDYQYYTIPEESLQAQQETQVDDSGNRSIAGGRGGFVSSQQTNAFNNLNQQVTVVRSPLADNIEHDLAYFNFQVDEETNAITSPNGNIDQQQAISTTEESIKLNELVESNVKNVRDNLLPVLNQLEDEKSGQIRQKEIASQEDAEFTEAADSLSKALPTRETEEAGKGTASAPSKSVGTKAKTAKRTGSYNIEGLQNFGEEPQVQTQSRNFIMSNSAQNELGGAVPQGEFQDGYQQQGIAMDEENSRLQQPQSSLTLQERQDIPQQPVARGADGNGQVQVPLNAMSNRRNSSDVTSSTRTNAGRSEQLTEGVNARRQMQPGTFQSAGNQDDTVEVTIEPFVTVVVPGGNNKDSIFGGQVFMVRRIKYEGKELIQGFQLNEKKLLEEVEKSTKRFMRDGMNYEMSRNPNAESAYTAILDFVGFGRLFLNLFETDPGRLAMQISHLRTWYFSILSVVFLAVTFAVASLWLNARAQIKLAQKKDDFVSAVSHELRTPLTSIRMHAEMLEKNWVKSESKLSEYYRSMRAESERLSRLIENVLDFSRIQKGRKKYVFKLGDINKCVAEVVEMMTAYALQKGFRIKTELGECREVTFDSDAVTQIVVNLLDNAVKYSGNSEDKSITVRTKSDDGFVLIEVEDHGPGIPHRQRKRIFQEFYRIGAEATRETAGSGLGLALVKKFAQAHDGFVEIISARPTGSIFRVALAIRHGEGV